MPTLSIPADGNIKKESGTILLKITHLGNPEHEHILTSGKFQLFYKNNEFIIQTNKIDISKQLHLPVNVFPGTVKIIWSWKENDHRLMAFADNSVDVVKLNSNFDESIGTIELAKDPLFSGIYNGIECYQTDLISENIRSIQKTIEAYEALISIGKIDYQSTYTLMNHQDISGFELAEIADSASLKMDFSNGIIYKEEPKFEVTMAPRDGSPILVSDKEGPFRRSYFLDQKNGEYTTVNKEYIVYRKDENLFVSYEGFNPKRKVTVKYNGEDVGNGFKINENQITLNLTEREKNYFYGKELEVTYELDKSYTIEHNFNTAYDSYRVGLSNHKNKPIKVIQEGNRFSTERLAKEIELNPLVNPRNTGFMYMSNGKQITKSFRLSVSSEYLIADGLDSADVSVEVIDQDGNEVLSPYLNVSVLRSDGQSFDSAGMITPIVSKDTLKSRITSGRCYYKYNAPYLAEKEGFAEVEKVFIVIYDRKNKIGTQIPIYLKRVDGSIIKNDKNKKATHESVYSAIPFEYFARYYERKLPILSPLIGLDIDQDGVLNRNDWLIFEKTVSENTAMQSLTHELMKKEEF